MKFANQILAHNYSNCQLEIDDKWQTIYGDFTFEKAKFPDMSRLVKKLNSLGYRTTLWVHPFANVESVNFRENIKNQYWVRGINSSLPALTHWWDGPLAGILDTTNENATDWFVSKLEEVRQTAGIDSFKFDAGNNLISLRIRLRL